MIDSMQLQHKRTQSFPIQEVQTLIRKLRVANEVDIIQALNKLIDEKNEHYSVELLHAFILYISSCIAQVGMEYNIHPDEMIDNHLFKVIVENDTIDEMKAYLHQQCKMIMAVRDSEQRKFKKLSAEAAIKYIEANFKKPISLESVSSEINMSASYLSRLIKQELGINFNTYLHKLRIEESLKLLKNEDMTIKEISNAVGYLSEHTFIRNFKSLMGKTPNHYRNSNLI